MHSESLMRPAPAGRMKRFFQSEGYLFLLLVFLLSYFTYFHNYQFPPHVFWDENYHIASAQKYLNGVYFMEQHPPLGKLLIALGEKMLNRNPSDAEFIGTDYATNFSDEFSFAGYRFFPALLAWLTAPLLYFIFLLLTKRPLWAALLSFFYIFDNALIVHLRGAMLESTLIFFMALTLLLFLLLPRLRERADQFSAAALWFGIALAAVFATKLLGLVTVLFVPVLFWQLRGDRGLILRLLFWGGLGFLVMYIAVWQVHFSLGRTINPVLPDQGLYQASPAYKEILTQGKTHSLLNFPVMWKDSINFVSHYNRGTPRLDLCKPDENGSPFFFWPIGARSINYRWETPNSQAYRYLYLQSNPAVWWTAFLGVLIAISLIVSSLFGEVQRFKRPLLLLTFLGVYGAYMVAISRIDRVMYLYHYFTPLFLSFIIFGLVFLEIEHIAGWALTEMRKSIVLLCIGAFIFTGFQVYRPFTYYEPILDSQVTRRAFFPYWELHCVNCPKRSLLVVPRPALP
ncbi:phospholipid carrier-dependent glycosyltransferase [Candidatus Peregrinibacteria bacterium]|nr:phospholipid carrier-dependent glycosyltransferase [Candidatus Peregrinibacteria bacterium]